MHAKDDNIKDITTLDISQALAYTEFLSKDECVKAITTEYLHADDFDETMPPSQIKQELLAKMHEVFTDHNTVAEKGAKWQLPSSLFESQIADILLRLYPICRIACAGANADTEYDLLAIYQSTGPDEGIYVTKETVFNELIRQFNYNITTKGIHEVIMCLRDVCERKLRCTDPDLIAVNNGIFNYNTKQLQPFDPKYVFIAKSRVDYNPFATNITIHNPDDNTDWNVEDWVTELSDNPEIVELLWQIMGAIIRPHVNWNKSAWFYSTKGNNGKGTLCALMRNICGKESYASIPLSDFGKDFMLEPLLQATAIIVDENNVGEFIDKAANLKAVITNDVIQLNRKFKTPIAYQFYGFMVQCINELPRIRDKSDSFYRRQLFVPFDKCFTGHERRYIKSDYLNRPEVLEYVLFKVLNMNYYELNEPEECVMALSEYKMFNDPIKQFIDEFISQCVWDVLPFSFLYDGYKAWYKKNSPEGKMQGKSTFITDLLSSITNDSGWYCPGRSKAIKTGSKMDKPELLIWEYELNDWKNPYYKGGDIHIICKAPVKQTVNGLIRI
jgi:putative DNA primase/helicase